MLNTSIEAAINLLTLARDKTSYRMGGALYETANRAEWLETAEALICIHSESIEVRDRALVLLAAIAG